MFGISYVRDVGLSECVMWDVQNVGYLGYAMFRMWNVGCRIFAGMWDFGLQNAYLYH